MPVGVGVGATEGVGLGLEDTVGVGVGDAVNVAEGVAVAVVLGVVVGLGVGVLVGEGVPVFDAVGVGVAVALGVPVAEGLVVGEGEGDRLGSGVGVGDPVGVAVPESATRGSRHFCCASSFSLSIRRGGPMSLRTIRSSAKRRARRLHQRGLRRRAVSVTPGTMRCVSGEVQHQMAVVRCPSVTATV